jgi:hypothetical protein
VALHTGTEAVRPVLEGLSGEGTEVHVVPGSAPDAEDWVARVLGGARLVIVGGEGPLLDKLHFFRVPGGVSGVGYIVEPGRAVAGPRGAGWAVFIGEDNPDAGLVKRCVEYVEDR